MSSSKDVYDWYVKEGYINCVKQGGLSLYNYTDECVFQNNWNFHTKSARGLVLDQDGKVIAKPFDKFWNLNERPETVLHALPQEIPELSEKYDGSMMVVFENPETGHWQSVTRGCWDNMQTQFTNKWLANGNSARLEPGHTHIFELIAPWNRIVVAYPKEDLVLTGLVHTESARDFSYKEVREFAISRGITPVYFENKPLHSLKMDDPSVVNQEGFVARFSNGFRVKIKYESYVLLHRIVTGLSIKGIWESLSTGKDIDLSHVPEEFRAWFVEEKLKLFDAYREIEKRVNTVFETIPKTGTRKESALEILKHKDIAAILFQMLDKNPNYTETIWKMVKPVGFKTFQNDGSQEEKL
jgi:RNA ligase